MRFKLTGEDRDVGLFTPCGFTVDRWHDAERVSASGCQLLDHGAVGSDIFKPIVELNDIEIHSSGRFVPAQGDRAFCLVVGSEVVDFVWYWIKRRDNRGQHNCSVLQQDTPVLLNLAPLESRQSNFKV